MNDRKSRRFPVGAEILTRGGVSFRVWSSKRTSVTAVLEGGPGAEGREVSIELEREPGGYFSATVPAAGEGTLYRFRLDGETMLYPDPASRYQPSGPHGPSVVIDPGLFRWTDQAWPGLSIEGQVIYEMHLGTFTPEGTWLSAARELAELAACGITAVEVMPVAEFPGRFGWGYDGVDLFAPTRLYGPPDAFRAFVDAAHGSGIGVILDVVYNHLGPDGSYLHMFSDEYFTDRYTNEWGRAINFDGEASGPVRDFFCANARYWIEEFHLDGLRLDATQSMIDESSEHIVSAVARAVREGAEGRRTLVIAENEPQHAFMALPREKGGFGIDALWNDDFHHSAQVALIGHHEAYYSDYRGRPQEFISMIKSGFLYQGQYYLWQSKYRGTPTGELSPAAFVQFIQNHDQVANSCCGQRIHDLASPGLYRAMMALLLLAPGTPLLFQGQEFAASAPFLYFVDLPDGLSKVVHEGRLTFLSQFPSLADPSTQRQLPDSSDVSTFLRSKLDLTERESHASAYALHKDLLRIRRVDPVFRAQKKGGADGAVLGPDAFVLRFFGSAGDDRLLMINLGADLLLSPAPEPILAPPRGKVWKLVWSSEDLRYGGMGIARSDTGAGWTLTGRSAALFAPGEEGREERGDP